MIDFDKGKPPHLDPFLYDFQSRFWITYRSEIPITPEFPFSSDAGWGCMIRSGQMLIAQAYACYFLGRDWLVTTGDFPYLYWRILHMFRDLDEPSSPFSIQNIMKVGARLGVSAGEWLSPTLIGDILCCLMTKLKRFDIGFYVCRSGTLPKDDFCAYALATGVWKPTIVYIPVRLGLSTINPIYAPQILKTLSWRQSLGIVGGKPKASCYFIGYQEESVFYLDPHVIQSSLGEDSEVHETYHCRRPLQMHVLRMDPCMGLGFFCPTLQDFEELCDNIEQICEKKGHEIISLCQSLPSDGSGQTLDFSQLYKYQELPSHEIDEFILV
eukprot:TRINITY_DN2024_c0_g1_i13.p1 TRINITY_DN2024_c0_g1~~TRINITY_DN2024_c0_g1_i13.p1  ORF type:complete len:326 (-),score=32.67 TRINITY_DN2024_c0_g1_i13:261-1238(-)